MMRRMKVVLTAASALLALTAAGGGAQTQQGASRDTSHAAGTTLAGLRAELEAYEDQMDSVVNVLRDSLRFAQAGTNRFVLAGYGHGEFVKWRNGTSTFTNAVSPILIWQLTDRVLFQEETEFEMGEELETNVEYANVSYLATDWLSVGAGKILTPFNAFVQRLHPAWINKTPDMPLTNADESGLIPEQSLGAFASGGFPVGTARASYSLYAVNAPAVATMGESAGQIMMTDANTAKAYGGRVGLFLLPAALDLGLSYQTSSAAKLQGADIGFSRSVVPLGGNLDVRAEGVIFDGVNGPFQPDTAATGDQYFVNNHRVSGYGQVAYRPSLARGPVARNLEGVARYDFLNAPDWRDGAPGNHAQRFTAGVNCWVRSSMVFKLAYEKTTNTTMVNTQAVVFQVATGF